jgi:hypothetical protein
MVIVMAQHPRWTFNVISDSLSFSFAFTSLHSILSNDTSHIFFLLILERGMVRWFPLRCGRVWPSDSLLLVLFESQPWLWLPSDLNGTRSKSSTTKNLWSTSTKINNSHVRRLWQRRTSSSLRQVHSRLKSAAVITRSNSIDHIYE